MASAKFIDEVLTSDIDESAVSALVGSLENQLVTSTPTNADQSTALNPQNHINSAIANGGTIASSQKHHGTIANGNSLNINDSNKVILNNTTIVTCAGATTAVPVCVQQSQALSQQQHNTVVAVTNTSYTEPNKLQHSVNDGAVKIVYTQGNHQAMTSTGAFLTNRVTFPTVTQTLPNGTIGLSAIAAQQPTATVLHTTSGISTPNLHTKQPTIVLKTAAPTGTGAGGLMTVPMNVQHQVNNQLILQSLQGLQPGQQGQLLLKTENGQFQLLRVGPAPAGVSAGPNQNVTFRMQPVAAQPVTTTAIPVVSQCTVAPAVTASTITTTPTPKPATDNTKEKCRKFLANLLELSSREPKSVERNVRTLIQELIDMRVEPEDFCDRLERLLNASPQPCLIGFLKKSLPLLRHSLATKEMTIDGIRPPPANVVFSIASAPTTITPTGTATLIQTQQQVVRPTITQQHVRLVAPGTVVRPQQIQIQGQQRLVTPIRAPGVQMQQQIVQRMVRPQQVMVNNQPVIVSTSQPPALHPVIYNTHQQQQAPTQQQILRGVTPVTVSTAPHLQSQGPTQVNIIRGPTLLQHQQLQHQHLQQQQQQQTICAGTAPTNVQVLRQNQVVNASAMGLSGGPAAATLPMAQSGPIPPNATMAPGGGNKLVMRTVKTPNATARMKANQAAAATATSRAAAAIAAAASSTAALAAAASAHALLSATAMGSSSVTASIAAVASGAGGPPSGSVAVAAAVKQAATIVASAKLAAEAKKSFSSASAAAYAGDDDINDVAAMGGVNLAEETQRILGSTEFVGTQIRSCKEEFFLSMAPLQMRIRQAMARHSLDEPQTSEVAAVISHAAQERIRNLVEKLAIVTEHRLEMVKGDARYEIRSDVKGQLKFLEELDRAERKRHEEMERELLLRAAKSRSKTEDPEQAKLKAKAKEMQRVEMEELRQREANATALQAIGPRKKPRLDGPDTATPGTSQATLSGTSSTASRGQMPLRQRLKKVTMKDLQFMFESEKDLCKSTLLYKSYLK